MQSNPVNTDTEGAIESVRINGVSVLTGRNLEKYEGFLSPGTKQPVRIKRVSWMTLRQNNRFKVWPNVMKDTKTSRENVHRLERHPTSSEALGNGMAWTIWF